jgi:mannose-6-phosphate isomerase-like protein (cupin superfamily)
MDLEAYMSSGIVEDYCLGILNQEERNDVLQQAQSHPEIKQAIDEFMQSLEEYSIDANIVSPPAGTKQKLLQLLGNFKLEEEKNIHELPLLNKYTDHKNWLHIVAHVLPETLNQKMFVHELRNDNKVSQTLIWTAIDYPDEVHEDVQECFIILRGKCRCYIEDEIVELGPGGYLEIPMYAHHNVEVLGADPVLAVVQRIKVA